MNDEALLIRTLNDLHQSINSDDEYEVLRASGLIRQLFLDGGNSLFDRVNRNYRLRLEFEIAESPVSMSLPIKPTIYASFTELEPKDAPAHWIRKRVRRDNFFALIVATVEEHEYSIKELIKFAANTMGGIHSGDSSDDKEKNLETLKSLYVFSNVNTALLFVRAVGRNILEALTPLRNKILEIERFENAKGFSLYFAIILLPQPEKENFILDIGIEEQRNRLSIFLNSNGELCFRCFNSVGRRYLIKAGSDGHSYSYGQRIVLSFQISFNEKELFLCIEDKDWKHIEIQPINLNEFSQQGFEGLPFVVGSNISGKAETHMQLIRWCGYSRILTQDEHLQVKNEMAKDFNQKEIKVVSFKGNQFLHSENHPNFVRADST